MTAMGHCPWSKQISCWSVARQQQTQTPEGRTDRVPLKKILGASNYPLFEDPPPLSSRLRACVDVAAKSHHSQTVPSCFFSSEPPALLPINTSEKALRTSLACILATHQDRNSLPNVGCINISCLNRSYYCPSHENSLTSTEAC